MYCIYNILSNIWYTYIYISIYIYTQSDCTYIIIEYIYIYIYLSIYVLSCIYVIYAQKIFTHHLQHIQNSLRWEVRNSRRDSPWYVSTSWATPWWTLSAAASPSCRRPRAMPRRSTSRCAWVPFGVAHVSVSCVWAFGFVGFILFFELTDTVFEVGFWS